MFLSPGGGGGHLVISAQDFGNDGICLPRAKGFRPRVSPSLFPKRKHITEEKRERERRGREKKRIEENIME